MGSQQLLTYRPLPGVRLNMAHPLARHLVLCLNFNEQGSRAMDLSPSSAHGRLSGFGSPAKRHIAGLDFNPATPSYVEIPASHTQLNFTSGDYSIIARLNTNSLASQNYIYSRGFYDNDGYFFYIEAGGNLDAYTTQGFGANQLSRSPPGAIVVNTDYTVGLSRAGTSIKLYKNGRDVTVSVGTHIDPATSARNAYIGKRDDDVRFMSGIIQTLLVYSRALSEAEHKAFQDNLYAPFGYPMFI